MADFTANEQLVQKMYIAFYGRPADPQGLKYWASQLPANATLTDTATKDVISRFINTDEAKARIGNVNDSTMHDAIIEKIYTQAFHRDITPTELNNLKTVSISDVLANVVGVNQGTDYLALNNKLAYANEFVKALDPNLDGIANDDATATKFKATFAGITDASDIAAKLLFIDNDTTATSADVQNDIKLIADPTDEIQPPTGGGLPGQTFTLTTSPDNIVGTAGNDVINGYINTTATATTTTLSSADVIDGSGGTDSLKLTVEGNVAPTLPKRFHLECRAVLYPRRCNRCIKLQLRLH